jgi:hypothetical protein
LLASLQASEHLFFPEISYLFVGLSEPSHRHRRLWGVMNHSMKSADRTTHLKIVVVGLLCAIVVAGVGIFAHVSSGIDLGTEPLVKAGQPTALGGSIPTIR